MGTFERAASAAPVHPFALYLWNMRVSAALLLPLHVCEVVLRNAIADALALQHGPHWPWRPGLRASLPGGASGYNAREELSRAAAGCSSTPSVVSTLRFAFWQNMFTQRFDRSLWRPTLHRVMPGTAALGAVHIARAALHADVQRVRLLRNRIAHHEPVFMRDLGEDLATMGRIVRLRCAQVDQWMQRQETVTQLLHQRPI
ncbi:hypothetical protein [Stenotrophomonas sp. GZD-301]|uniref:hypothetical protein n=1 Tax=Stenotrophomonas sp. GZD-301 TaxID=3404814 RepID=UPI003BB76194